MNKIKSNLGEKLIKFCFEHKIQLCIKCLMRFSNIKNFNLFKRPSNQLVESVSVTVLDETQLMSQFSQIINSQIICFSCLNLLSDSYCHRFVQQLTDFLSGDKCQHKFSSFQLFISIPVSITLRNELLVQKFQNYCQNSLDKNGVKEVEEYNEKDVDFQTIFSVKDILRVILIDSLEERLKDKPFDANSLFQINVDLSHKQSDTECQKFYELSPKSFFPKKCRKSMNKSFLNQSSILRALAVIDKSVLNEWPITGSEEECQLSDIKLTNSPIYIAGRYMKYSRTLSQTPWILDEKRLMESSVQDIIQDILKEFILCDQLKFSSSGREDVDVRMLGRGRPFIFEVLNPRITSFNPKEFQIMMSAINGSQKDVSVRDLQIVTKDSIHSDLKEGENQKQKTYRALCCLSRELTDDDIKLLSETKDLVIQQKTPIRVLHRRTLSVRPKHIYKLWAERVIETEVPEEHRTNMDRLFTLNLTAEAGTYIKEFVHSDFGRTQPNLATILGNCSADILLLDVMVCFQ